MQGIHQGGTQNADLQNRAQNVNRDNALRGAGDGNAARQDMQRGEASRNAARTVPAAASAPTAAASNAGRRFRANGGGVQRGGGGGNFGGGGAADSAVAAAVSATSAATVERSRGVSDDSLISIRRLRARVLTLAVALGTTGTLLAAPALLLGTTAAHAQAVYPTADDAANAFVDALARNDEAAMKHVLGNDFHRFIPSEGIGEDDIYQFLGAWSKGHQIVEDPAKIKGRATAHLAVGDSGWTLPIPLVQAGKGWRFDPPAAQDEMLTRRIGRNERAAILTSLAYLDAQNDYHNLTQHYAQRFVSTPGQHDGLYWVTAPGETESPLGPLAATMPNGTLPNRGLSRLSLPDPDGARSARERRCAELRRERRADQRLRSDRLAGRVWQDRRDELYRQSGRSGLSEEPGAADRACRGRR